MSSFSPWSRDAERHAFRPLAEPPPAAPPAHDEETAVALSEEAAPPEQVAPNGLAEAAELARGFTEGIAALEAARRQLRARYEEELVTLALGVARKVVCGELEARPEIWMRMIREAARRAVDRDRITVRVPAALYRFLREHMADLQAQMEDIKEVRLVEDPGLPASGCMVETRYGEFDIGVETQIEEVNRALATVSRDG